MYKNLWAYLVAAAFTIYTYLPSRHAKWYDYVAVGDTLGELQLRKIVDSRTNLETCPYEDVVAYGRRVDISEIYKFHSLDEPFKGGEHFPRHCTPLIKSAIIVPYRDRQEQLKIFLNYIHDFLQKQYIHYRIFVVEQNDRASFNRAKLLNIGAKEAMRMNFTCLILHDVDLIPLHTGNIYACSKRPRHMCSALDTLRYNLPYEELFGGVISVTADQFKQVNGMSNEYIGWGGEDDDLYRRLKSANFTPYRFAPSLSRYIMLRHKKVAPSESRFKRLEAGLSRQEDDGLNSLADNYVVSLQKLYTHIMVSS